MGTSQQRRYWKYGALAVMMTVALGTGLTPAAYTQNDQIPGNEYASAAPSRDLQLEQQIANVLRQQGYGAQGEIMILATGNQVTLLGRVPTEAQKDGAGQITQQVAQGKTVNNRLDVGAPTTDLSDAVLANEIRGQLGGSLSNDVRVQVEGGVATLSGSVNNWKQVEDAIAAAFAAGANRVNSQFMVASAGAGGTPAYGYIPGQQGAGAGMTHASSSDLMLARQVAGQLQQQLPPGQNVQLIQPQSIYVSASQGTVTLHGYVQSNNEKQQAGQIVRSIPGVQNVRDDLTILSTGGAAAQGGWQGAPGGQQAYGQGGFPGQTAQGTQGGQAYYGQGGQGQYGQESQTQGSQQSFGGQSQYGQGGQPGYGGQSQYGQTGQMGGAQPGFGGQSQYGQTGQMGGTQPGFGGQTSMSPSDLALAQHVVQQLHQQLQGIQNIQVMRPGTIYVMAAGGDVVLGGFITNPNIKRQAAQIASAIPGVRNVTDSLRVIGSTGAGASPSYGYIPGQEDQTGGQEGAPQGTGEQGMGQQGTTDQEYGAQTQYIAERDRDRAEASRRQNMSRSDLALARELAQRIQRQTGQRVEIETPGTVYVRVANGTATLEGFVPSNDIRRRVEQVANSVNGVRNVRNSLNIGVAPGYPAYGYLPPYGYRPGSQQFGNEPYGYRYGEQR